MGWKPWKPCGLSWWRTPIAVVWGVWVDRLLRSSEGWKTGRRNRWCALIDIRKGLSALRVSGSIVSLTLISERNNGRSVHLFEWGLIDKTTVFLGAFQDVCLVHDLYALQTSVIRDLNNGFLLLDFPTLLQSFRNLMY